MIITFISDTHGQHKKLDEFLPGGDLLLCAGDITGMGHQHEIDSFCGWYHKIEGYKSKIFIAGNHDFGFQKEKEKSLKIISSHSRKIIYLEDSSYNIDNVNIYGSPWQPEFFNWAYNLPRTGEELKSKWDAIPENTDILITHGPPYGILDQVGYNNVGCELLLNRIKEIKPKIHLFGHIHEGYGYVFNGNTHYINASVLDERYNFNNKPLTINWDPITNELEFIDL